MDPPVRGWERYEIVEFLGEGGMGRVFKARDPKLDRLVALKFILGDSPEQSRRLLHEATLNARVKHPNVCEVYEVGEVEGKPYIAMEFLDGSTLDEAAAGMSLEDKLTVLIAVAHALDSAHRAGLIHRDVKPANIMVSRTADGWLPKVMDFGLSREMAAPGLTQTGMMGGTPASVAPEQARGVSAELDCRADVYSLGATLYQLVVGRVPFDGPSSMDVLMKVLHKEPVPPRREAPALPVDLETIILKCLDKTPERRYQSARTLADDLQRLLDGEPILARPASWTYRLSKRVQKQRALWALAALLVLVTVGSAGYLIHSHRQQRLRERIELKMRQGLRMVPPGENGAK